MCTYIYIYICIERERERERDRDVAQQADVRPEDQELHRLRGRMYICI